MISDRTLHSPDGLLRLAIRVEPGDVTIGFEGFPWHTHADILAAIYGLSQEAAVERFIQLLLENTAVIAIVRKGEKVVDAWVTDYPEDELRREPEDGETLEGRLWDGTAWHPS